jgi:hypothetical protein
MDFQPAAHQAARGKICKFYTLTKFHNNFAVRRTTYCLFATCGPRTDPQ